MKTNSFLIRLSIMLLFLYFHTPVFSQTVKQVPGFAINKAGDTVHGTFDNYADWQVNPDKVSFIPSKEGRPTTLTPLNTIEFKAQGYNTYTAFSGFYLKSSNEYVSRVVDNQFDNRRDSITTFLEVLFASPEHKLLMLQLSKRIYFVQAGSAAPKELVLINADHGTHFSEVARYKQDLRDLFTGLLPQDKLDNLLRNVNYAEKSLVNFFEKATGITKTSRKERIPSQYFVIGGVALNSLLTKGDNKIFAEPDGYQTTVAPFLRVGMVLYNQRNYGRLFLSPSVGVYSYKQEGSYKPRENYSSLTTYQSGLVIYPSIHIGAHVVNTERVKVFLAGGPGMLLLSRHKRTQVRTQYATSETYNDDLYSSILNVSVQAGVSINRKFVVSASYILPTMVTSYANLQARHTSLQAGIGYRF